MGTDAPHRVIIDTSTLINFLCIARVDLLAGLPHYVFVTTDHVRSEVLASFPKQLAALEAAYSAGQLQEVAVDSPHSLEIFGDLKALRLGNGECASIAAAVPESLRLAIDDRRARNRALERWPSLVLLDTMGLMIEAILEKLLSIEEADAIKLDWEVNHRFAKKNFRSFSDFFPRPR